MNIFFVLNLKIPRQCSVNNIYLSEVIFCFVFLFSKDVEFIYLLIQLIFFLLLLLFHSEGPTDYLKLIFTIFKG